MPPPAEPGQSQDAPDEKAELRPEEARERRQNRWLVILTVVALLAAGGAGYAISQVEEAKDENREDDQAVNSLRADLEVMREQLNERLDSAESRLDDAADGDTQRKLEQDLQALNDRVQELDQQGGGSGNLATRIDDLEQRVEDLEAESN